MAKYDFKGKNNLRARELFESRKQYRDEALFIPEEDIFLSGVQDFFLGTNLSFYGRVDELRNFVTLAPSRTKYFSAKYKDQAKAGAGPQAADFVVDAFHNFMGEFERLLNENNCGVSASDIGLQVISAWIPYKDMQHMAYQQIAFGLKNYLFAPTENKNSSKKRNELQTIEQFLKQTLKFTKNNVRTVPITGTSMMSSKYCSVATSGLAITLKKIKKDNDEKKSEFMNGIIFDFYRKAALTHGFMVDRNAPWQIVANLDSPAMETYMAERMTSKEGLWKSHYTLTQDTDLSDLKNFILSMWNGLVDRAPYTSKREQTLDGKGTRAIVTKRQRYTLEEMDQKIGKPFWIKFYCEIKAAEAAPHMSARERFGWRSGALLEKIKKIAVDLEKNLDTATAIGYINDQFDAYVFEERMDPEKFLPNAQKLEKGQRSKYQSNVIIETVDY